MIFFSVYYSPYHVPLTHMRFPRDFTEVAQPSEIKRRQREMGEHAIDSTARTQLKGVVEQRLTRRHERQRDQTSSVHGWSTSSTQTSLRRALRLLSASNCASWNSASSVPPGVSPSRRSARRSSATLPRTWAQAGLRVRLGLRVREVRVIRASVGAVRRCRALKVRVRGWGWG